MSTSGQESAGDTASLGVLAGIIDGQVSGDSRLVVTGVSLDSRLVVAGDLFAALSGHSGHISHGAHYIDAALNAGAVAVLTDDVGQKLSADICDSRGISMIVARDIRKQLGKVCIQIYGQPTIKIIGITGTNGKTTTAYMVMRGAASAGLKTGMIGTLATYIGATELPANRTTPEAPEIFQLLSRMQKEDIDLVVMEVSSIAIAESRISGLNFDAVGFTNLSLDHLDYHGSMENYFKVKAELFSPEIATRGVVCVNDAWGRKLVAQCVLPIQSVFVSPVSDEVQHDSDWNGVSQKNGDLVVYDPEGSDIRTHMASPGIINAMNATLAIALLDNVGLVPALTHQGVGSSVVPGRGQLVSFSNNIAIYVDYAHSPMAIELFLTGLPDTEQPRLFRGRTIVVIGAGGDRDTGKRPLMGAAAARLSDILIVTDDNPRSEDPADIRRSIVQGTTDFPAVHVENIEGRRNGIRRALELAESGDVVAVLGKGHEKVIEICGETIPFNDAEVIRELINRV